ncbi:helix-turn-helix domain-containing protein [Vagococcus sp. AM17-17]|nr:helix-turn-helix domain-containing protein [Vagococcus sp. AM17-17]
MHAPVDTIGEQLKKARLKKGLTIEDLQKITKIQRRYLSAIEANDFDAMPSDYYTRTFIRQYAEAVGLNSRPLIRRFEGKPDEIYEQLPSATPVKGSRKEKHQKEAKKQTSFKSYLPVILLSLVVIAIIGTIIYAMRLDIASGPLVPKPEKTVVIGSSSDQSEESRSQSSTTETSKETKESSSKKADSENKFSITSDTTELVTYAGKNVSTPIKLDFTALEGPVWIGLQQSGTNAIYYQYTLQPGETISSVVPEEATGIDIIVGASNNLSVKVNNKELAFNKANPTTGKKIITINFDTTKENE